MGESGELSGRTLGQYELGDLLGEGGMAAVYQARQSSIGRTVAIKVMPSHFMRDKDFLARFEREVKVIADLQHPRVLPVYDFGHIENRPYIVMAYLSGGTLEDRIRRGALSLPDTLRLVQQMAEGLDFAHAKGIIHRDFKPGNVLLDEQGNAHLADFGIARISASSARLTESGIVGTPTYIAPEMLQGGEVAPAVDIYALGVTIYEMLAGTTPFAGDTPMRLITAHLYDPIPDIRQVRPDLPEGVTYVIQRAMAKNPAHRFVNAGHLAATLAEAAAGKSITPPPMTDLRPVTARLDMLPPPVQPRTPRTLWFGLGAVVLIAAIIGLAAALGVFSNGAPGVAQTNESDDRSPIGTQPETSEPTPTVGGTPLAFPAAAEDEVLVIVTDFEQEGVNADTRIYQALAAQVRSKDLQGVRVQRLDGVKQRLQEEAIEIGEQYNATLVIWGTADSIGISPNYEIVRHQEAITGAVELGAGAGSDATSYSAYITEGINNEFEFLMLYILAQLAIANDQPETAADLLRDAISIDVGAMGEQLGVVDANMLLCKTNLELDDFDQAIVACSAALELDPEFETARYYRGISYAEIGDTSAALTDLNDVFDVSETSSYGRFDAIGVSLRENNQLRASLVYFDRSLEIAPSVPYLYYDRAVTLRMLGLYDDALSTLNQGLGLSEGNETVRNYIYMERSIVYYHLGDFDAAIADCDTLVELSPEHPDAYNQRAFLHAATGGSLDQALADANHALELIPLDDYRMPSTLDTRAFIYYKMGNYQAALADLDAAMELVGGAVDAPYLLFRYAQIYDTQGQTDLALEYYYRFLGEASTPLTIDVVPLTLQRIEALGGEIPEGYSLP